jgi:hypothetical protein
MSVKNDLLTVNECMYSTNYFLNELVDTVNHGSEYRIMPNSGYYKLYSEIKFTDKDQSFFIDKLVSALFIEVVIKSDKNKSIINKIINSLYYLHENKWNKL